MRLLNVYHYEFREFDLPDTPPYVIASHTWEQGSEITFEEFQQGGAHEKGGHQKVVGFANYVKEHVPSVEWLWIDTCCIDQSNAQEVTKAINSMFRWYLHAAVCLAYLSDVQEAQDGKSFEESKWFKRGWTLQELLASRVVVFLTRQWQTVGHKADSVYRGKDSVSDMGLLLNSTIANITGVPEVVLENFYQSRFLSIEERLRWIEVRETTEPEDMSYSLMGIFDVKMITNYGEGEDRARRRLLTQIEQNNATLSKLPAAAGAAFNSLDNEVILQCLAGTRVELLQDIDQWATSRDSACIFWLSGMAGTGKSTILKTIAQTFEDQHRLAASFCFKRGEADRRAASRLIATISAQLAQRLPDVSAGVISALEMDPDIMCKSLSKQFQKLILQPIQHFASPPVYGSAWIICIDALDECDDESAISIIINMLAKLTELKSANFRLFITSRPDLPLRLGFSRMSQDAHTSIRLEEIPKDIITRDITVFLEYRLSEIRSAYASLNGIGALERDWPGKDAVKALVQMAQPLFIFAATACRLLGELDEDPRETLRSILEHRLEASQLDRTYQPVLDRLLTSKTKRQQEQIIEDFQAIVGAIIVLAEPLTITALSKILSMSEEKISARLQRLHSVLDVPVAGSGSGPVRLLHLSFHDYLTDIYTREKTPFWVDKTKRHRLLVEQCLGLLSQPWVLKQDICDTNRPGTRRAKMTIQRIKGSISSDVAYACSHWVFHLTESNERLCDNGRVHQFLLSHFLHWLEALSWIGKLPDVVMFISSIRSLAGNDHGTRLLEFLDDATRFVRRNLYIIDFAPLQIYSSSLVFAPRESMIRSMFSNEIPLWLIESPNVHWAWGPELQRLEGHTDEVNAVAFSPDGQVLVSASCDYTIRMWDVATGQELHQLIGHTSWVNGVVYSPDGHVLVSSSLDDSVRVWSSTTYKEMRSFEGNGDGFSAVAFDGRILASASSDGKIYVWDATTGSATAKLEGHEDWCRSVAIFSASNFLASASRDQTVRLWDLATGTELRRFTGHNEWVNHVAFSHDGQMIVSASGDRTIRLWNIETGREVRSFLGHNDWVNAAVFSFDGRLIASASHDMTIRLWNTMTGDELMKIEGHDGWVNGLAFSSNGKVLASASGDSTVRLWDIDTTEQALAPREHEGYVRAVTFSSNGSMVASASDDSTIRLWDVSTKKCIRKLKGHQDTVWAIAFSPDSGLLASASNDQTICLWETVEGRRLLTLNCHDEWVNALTFSYDGVTMFSKADNRMVREWDMSTGKELRSFHDFNDTIRPSLAEGGKWDIDDAGAFHPCAPRPNTHKLVESHALVLGDRWVRHRDKDVLWLPFEFRGTCSSAHGTKLVVGQASGAVSFFDLQFDVYTRN